MLCNNQIWHFVFHSLPLALLTRGHCPCPQSFAAQTRRSLKRKRLGLTHQPSMSVVFGARCWDHIATSSTPEGLEQLLICLALSQSHWAGLRAQQRRDLWLSSWHGAVLCLLHHWETGSPRSSQMYSLCAHVQEGLHTWHLPRRHALRY